MPRKVTYQAAPVIWIRIAGESSPSAPQEADDDGLITAFQGFLQERGILTARIPGIVGAGRFSYGFHPDDLPAITAWLKAHGVAEVPQTITQPFIQGIAE